MMALCPSGTLCWSLVHGHSCTNLRFLEPEARIPPSQLVPYRPTCNSRSAS